MDKSTVVEKFRSHLLRDRRPIKKNSFRLLVLLISIFSLKVEASGNRCFDILNKTKSVSKHQELKEALLYNEQIAKTPAQIKKVKAASLATFQKLFPGTKNLSEITDDPTNHLRQHVDLPRLSFEEMSLLLQEQNIPLEVINDFVLVDIKGRRFADGGDHFGQILVHKTAVEDTVKFFKILYANDVPIGPIVPAQLFAGSDAMMVGANITSGANFRLVSGSLKVKVEVSFHTYGIAIDVNPKLNRWQKDPNKDPLLDYGYDPLVRGTLVGGSKVINEIESQTGLHWGGYWEHPDPQHFTHPFLARLQGIEEVDN